MRIKHEFTQHTPTPTIMREQSKLQVAKKSCHVTAPNISARRHTAGGHYAIQKIAELKQLSTATQPLQQRRYPKGNFAITVTIARI